MMNGHLMAHGYEPIGVPVEIRQQWNSALSSLYTTLDASELLSTLAGCQFSRIEERSQVQARPLRRWSSPCNPNDGMGM